MTWQVTISSADFLRQLNHAHKSWPTSSIVWQPLKTNLTQFNIIIIIIIIIKDIYIAPFCHAPKALW